MINVVITQTTTYSELEDKSKQIISDYKNNMSDYEIVEAVLDRFLLDTWWSSEEGGIRFNARRIVNELSGLGRESFATRFIDHKINFYPKKPKDKTSNRAEVITFNATRNKVSISMTITKVKTYCSTVEVLICDSDNKFPAKLLGNKELWERKDYLHELNYGYGSHRRETWLQEILDPANSNQITGDLILIGKLEKFIADLITKTSYQNNIENFIEDLFNTNKVNEIYLESNSGILTVKVK
jgi:hypothetical protein